MEGVERRADEWRFRRGEPDIGKFADAMAFQARIINDLQKSVMKIRMVPVEQLFRRFPRVVRDVAKSCSKEVALVMSGQDTDLDKSILDMLAEPLAHLVRNAVDHGIESPADRISAGKAAQGTVTLNQPADEDVEVSLAVDPPDAAKVPEQVLVPRGSAYTTFTIVTPVSKLTVGGEDAVV